jgi:hypothetical protein
MEWGKIETCLVHLRDGVTEKASQHNGSCCPRWPMACLLLVFSGEMPQGLSYLATTSSGQIKCLATSRSLWYHGWRWRPDRLGAGWWRPDSGGREARGLWRAQSSMHSEVSSMAARDQGRSRAWCYQCFSTGPSTFCTKETMRHLAHMLVHYTSPAPLSLSQHHSLIISGSAPARDGGARTGVPARLRC